MILLEKIKAALTANRVEGDPKELEKWILMQTHSDRGILIQRDRGFCFAYIDGEELKVWQAYNTHSTLSEHKSVMEELKEFGRRKGVKKLVMFVRGERYKPFMRLIGWTKPRIATVKMEVDL